MTRNGEHRTLLYWLVVALFASGCTYHPPIPASRLGIAFTSRNHTQLKLDCLPVADYPALKKFHNLGEVQYCWRTATDEKMEALAKVGLPNLRCVTMNGSSYITDRGITALAQIPSMDSLGLQGAAVTDASAELIARRMHPRGVNAAACTNVTMKGLLALIETESLESLSMSSEPFSTADFVQLLNAAKNVKWFGIVGKSAHLNHGAINQAAARKAIARREKLHVNFHAEGSIFMDNPLPSRESLK